MKKQSGSIELVLLIFVIFLIAFMAFAAPTPGEFRLLRACNGLDQIDTALCKVQRNQWVESGKRGQFVFDKTRMLQHTMPAEDLSVRITCVDGIQVYLASNGVVTAVRDRDNNFVTATCVQGVEK